MKKTIFLISVLLAVVLVNAEEMPSLFRKSIQMEKLRKDGKWLEAMDTATWILTYDKDYRVAVDYVHRYWDKTMKLTDERLQRLSDEESLAQAEERCEIYRVLDEIHDNLRVVKMPLYGPNEKWVWQPEVGYYTGHYDNERQKTFRLLLRMADEALRCYDAEGAGVYYRLALKKYLITDGERRSNLGDMTGQCNAMMEKHRNSDKIYNSIFAYDLCSLSLELNADQADVLKKQKEIQMHVADLYLQESEAARLAGDTAQAYELRLSADEWRVEPYQEESL